MYSLEDNEETTYSVNATGVPLSGEAAKQRAFKYHVALDQDSPGMETLEKDITSGVEAPYQQQMVAREMGTRVAAAKELLVDNVVANDSFTPEMAQAVADPGPAPDPDTIVEDQFTKKVMDGLLAADTPEEVGRVLLDNPMGFDKRLKAYEEIVQKNLIIAKHLTEMDEKVRNMGWGAWGASMGLTLLSLPSWYNIVRDKNGNIDNDAWFTNTSIQNKIAELRSLPPVEMDRAIRAEVAALESINPLDAQHFLQALDSYGANEANLDLVDNLSALPLGTAGAGLGKIARGAARAARNGAKVAEVMKAADKATRAIPETLSEPLVKPALEAELESMARALSAKSIDIPTVLSGTGRIKQASEQALRDSIAVKFLEDSPAALQRNFSDLLKKTTSFARPHVSVNFGDNLYAKRLDELDAITERAVKMLVETGNINRVSRVPSEVWDKAADMALDAYKATNKRIEDLILDVRKILPGDTPLNVGQLAITIGKKGKEGFQTREAAFMAMKSYGLQPEATVVRNVGGRYVLETYADVGEDKVLNLVLTPDNKPMNDTYTQLKGWLGSKLQTSKFQSNQRGAVTHGETAFGMIMRQLYEPYERLSKRERKALDNIMRANQNTEAVVGDPTTRGRFYTSEAEINSGYMRHAGRLPTAKEIDAYNAVVRASDIDYLYRVIHEYRRKASLGFQNITVRRMIQQGAMVDNTFEARIIDDLPADPGNIPVLHINREGIVSRYNLKDGVPQGLRDDIKNGYKVVQPYNIRDAMVQKTTGTTEPTAYFVVPSVDAAPLRLDKQVNYRPGFHNEYKSEWYVKQPRVLAGRFEGDTTAMGFTTEAEARRYGDALEKGRQLLKAGDMNALRAHLAKTLPYDLEDFRKTFQDHLSTTTPFAVVRRSDRSVKAGSKLLNGKSFVEEFGMVDSSLDDFHNPSAQFGDPFVAERDPLVHSVTDLGTEDAPVFELKTAQQFSPMLTQTRAMGKLIRSDLYNDYQLSSANHWVQEFAGDLTYQGKPVSKEMLEKNPVFFLKHGEINKTANNKRYQQAEQLRLAIQQLIGTPSAFAEQVDTIKQKMLSSIYTNLGERYLDYVPEAAIPMISDPLGHLRAVASHTKLGLFNPIQFFVQGSAVLNAAAISPLHATESFAASIAMRGLSLTEDPAIIARQAQHVAKFPGWTAEKFIESKRLMDGSGFDRIGQENAWRNTMGDPVLYRGKVGKVMLDKGMVFFNAGSRAVRLTAWNTSYLEYAKKFPQKVGKMTEYDVGQIRNRAQVLDANMTRDNNAFWQNGLGGSFTQFWAYNVRMAELMMGKQLTKGEKARLALAQGMLWGLNPLAVGAYAAYNMDAGALESMMPWGEDIKVHAYRNGINLDDTMFGPLYNGLVSTVFGMITGENLDFGSRYGMSPIQVSENLRRNFEENGAIRAVIVSFLGASGSVGNQILKESGNILSGMVDQAVGDGKRAELLPMDIGNALREISSVNFATKAYAALTGGMYWSQNGNIMNEDQDPTTAMLKAILGVQDVDETMAFNVMKSMKADQLEIDEIKKYMQRVQVRYLDAERRGDRVAAAEWFNTMAALLNATKLSTGEIMNILYPDPSVYNDIDKVIMEQFEKKLERDMKNDAAKGLVN